MSNKELFKQTFSELHASEEKVMEVIEMKKGKKIRKFKAKKIIAVAACVGTVLTAGVVANAATDGALVEGFFTIIGVSGEETKIPAEVAYDKDGNKITTATYGNATIEKKEGADEDSLTISQEIEGNSSASISVDGDGIIEIGEEADNANVFDGIDLDKYTEDGEYTAENSAGEEVKITVKNGEITGETENGISVINQNGEDGESN